MTACIIAMRLMFCYKPLDYKRFLGEMKSYTNNCLFSLQRKLSLAEKRKAACYPCQNRRQKVFTRGLCVSAGGFDTLKIDKNSTDL